MYKSKFTLSDNEEDFEGYTDGLLWNGWANVCFSREQIEEFLKSLPYDFKFSEKGGIPQVTIWWDKNESETTQSSPLPLDNGDIIEGYFLDGLEFMEVGAQ
jgi:hypothetical protein